MGEVGVWVVGSEKEGCASTLASSGPRFAEGRLLPPGESRPEPDKEVGRCEMLLISLLVDIGRLWGIRALRLGRDPDPSEIACFPLLIFDETRVVDAVVVRSARIAGGLRVYEVVRDPVYSKSVCNPFGLASGGTPTRGPITRFLQKNRGSDT